MKNDWKDEYKKVLKNYINVIIEYNKNHDEIRWILIFLQKRLVLNIEKMRIIEFITKEIYFHEKWNAWYCSNQGFYINSSNHKKLINII